MWQIWGVQGVNNIHHLLTKFISKSLFWLHRRRNNRYRLHKMTYSALFCSVVNKFYVLLHFITKLFSHTRTARWFAAMRTVTTQPSAAPSVLRWSRWRPALIYTHLRLQHWDIFSWSIRILRCPWCCFLGSDSDTFLIHKIFGASLALPQQLVVDRCWCLL